MRSLLFFAAIVGLIACSDQQQPTSPMASKPGLAIAPPTTASNGVGGVQAKPTDQVGLTKVEMIQGASTNIPAGSVESAYALCPQGSTAISGGYLAGAINGTKPFITNTYRVTYGAQTGWLTAFDNKAVGSVPFQVQPWVICIS